MDAPAHRNFREQWYDCGLIHRLDFRVVDAKGRLGPSSGSRVEFRTRRYDRATRRAPHVPVNPRRVIVSSQHSSPHIVDR
jgi:hypothetical protein